MKDVLLTDIRSPGETLCHDDSDVVDNIINDMIIEHTIEEVDLCTSEQ